MKNIFIIGLLFTLAESLSAQEVISTAGEKQSISGYDISWTLGEPIIETISSGATILTQGFHQSKLTVTAIDELLVSNLELKVYPNPTTEFVIIQINQLDNKPAFSLYDLSGKQLQSQLISTTETMVNLNKYASGTYFLNIKNNNKQSVQSFKIIKK